MLLAACMRVHAAVLLLAACSQRVYSPPARGLALESPKTVGYGQTAIQVAGGMAGAAFGPGLVVGDLSVRHGTRPDLDLVGDLSVMSVTDESAAGTDPNIFAARVGAKIRPEEWPVALLVGIGGGYAPAGGTYVAVDSAVVVGWENCVLVPFASTGLMASVPLEPRAIDVTLPGQMTAVMATPEPTYGWSVGVGLRLILSPARCNAGLSSVSLVATGGGTKLWDTHGSDGFGALGLGIEFPL
jgi:hypothetical protein